MRGKKAKSLRRIANERSRGMPMRRLIGKEHKRFIKDEAVIILQAVNEPNSTRGIYRALKRGAA